MCTLATSQVADRPTSKLAIARLAGRPCFARSFDLHSSGQTLLGRSVGRSSVRCFQIAHYCQEGIQTLLVIVTIKFVLPKRDVFIQQD